MVITMRKFYGQLRWRKTRDRRLRLDEYLCQECKRYGKTTQANHVHHIYPIETHWELRFNTLNLVSLCGNCHNQMHNRVTNAITAKGKEWQDRVELGNPPS